MKSKLLKTGGRLDVFPEHLSITFETPRRSLSTAIYGGGFRNIRYALNQKLTTWYPHESEFPGGSVPAFLKLCIEKHGARPEESSALLTSARMEWHTYHAEEKKDLIVEAVTTGGVEKTACRASSAALYEEWNGTYVPAGTINMIISINGRLPDGIMARALITATEGKSAALSDLGVADVNNGLPATGTCTDGITLITDPAGPLYTDGGGFSLLGSFIARCAYETVHECITRFDRPWNAFPELKTPAAVSLTDKKPSDS